MDLKSQQKWDQIYRKTVDRAEAQAASVVACHRHYLPASGRALDFACGRGGNAMLFAKHGLNTIAFDISAVALDQLSKRCEEQGVTVETSVVDLKAHCLEPASFDVLACSYYLDRSKLAMLAQALKPGGLLLYETFNASLPKGAGPSNPDFLLSQGELLSCFGHLHVLFYEELWGGVSTDGKTGISRLVARVPC